MAATVPTRRAILDLYSSTLRAAQSFSSYNFRDYFVQRTRERFRVLQAETDASKVQNMYKDAAKELVVLRRSAIVNKLYGGLKLAIELDGEKPEAFKEKSEL